MVGFWSDDLSGEDVSELGAVVQDTYPSAGMREAGEAYQRLSPRIKQLIGLPEIGLTLSCPVHATIEGSLDREQIYGKYQID